jgi:ankyrin repeat protein
MSRHVIRLVIPTFVALLFSGASPVKAVEPLTSNCLPQSVAHPTTLACHPLHDAVKTGNIVAVKLRLAEGADVNEVDVFGTPLHYAAALNSVDIAKVLIDAGANLEAEAVDTQKRSHPLHTAARANAVRVAELLISDGALVDARDAEGSTPLSVAAISGNADVAELLLSSGADPLAENSFHDMPIHVAACCGKLNVMQALISHGVGVNVRNKAFGYTPLWVATKWDRPEVVEFLLGHGADPNIPDNDGKTPLQVAETSMRALLLKHGAKQ